MNMHRFLGERITFLEGETIALKLRKHWILLLRDTIGTIALFFLPLLLVPLMPYLTDGAPTTLAGALVAPLALYASILWLQICFLALIVLWTDHYLDLWIVTNRRIISVDQISLFNRKVTSLSLDRIQEIIVKEENFMQAFFHYGTLDIETASPTDGDATMEGIPRPESVRRSILEQTGKNMV